MRKYYLITTLLACSVSIFAQQYSCEKLSQDISIWNSIKNKDNTKWTNAINYYFNVDNATRADMVTNSPSDGIIFKGKLIGIGNFPGLFEYNKINCDIIFDIRFKTNKIRFSTRIEDYQVIKVSNGIVVQNYKEYVKNCYPLNQNSDHKKSYAMSFINANSNCINYAKNFVDYINRNINKEQPTIKDDW